MTVARIRNSSVSLLAGLVGALACAGAMILAAIGVVSAGTAAGMAGMETHDASSEPGGIVGFLIREGPPILLASIALVTLSLAARRGSMAVPALLAGGLLYWGMYEQDRLSVMYVTIVLGLLVWVAAYLWVRGVLPRRAPRLVG